MLVNDPKVDCPEDSKMIWRYVSLGKFLSMITSGSLWFARIGAFEDAYEGTLSIPAIRRLGRSKNGILSSEAVEVQTRILGSLNAISRRYGFANCWHLNDGESDAFWRIYGTEAVAIQSTIGRLKQSFRDDDERPIKVGTVQYVRNPEQDILDNQDMDSVILTKRRIFDYEREVRAFSLIYPQLPETSSPDPFADLDMVANHILSEDVLPGHAVPIDLATMIEGIYIGPNQPSWFKEMLEEVVSRMGLTVPKVLRSTVGQRPEFWRDSVNLLNNQALLQRNLANIPKN